MNSCSFSSPLSHSLTLSLSRSVALCLAVSLLTSLSVSFLFCLCLRRCWFVGPGVGAGSGVKCGSVVGMCPGSSVRLDGSGQVEVSSNEFPQVNMDGAGGAGAGEFTMSAWLYRMADSNALPMQPIFSKQHAESNWGKKVVVVVVVALCLRRQCHPLTRVAVLIFPDCRYVSLLSVVVLCSVTPVARRV